MTRLEAVTIAIRAINFKLGQTKRESTRKELNATRDFFANDPAFEWERSTQSSLQTEQKT